MQFVIITGLSGAGKTLALHSFEDAGYYAADNVPPRLLPSLFDFCQAEGYLRGAVVTDTRCGPAFAELPVVLHELAKTGVQAELLFLDASDERLVQRYKETRRPHPLLTTEAEGCASGGIVEAIRNERCLLQTARALADRIIDTSTLKPVQLREAIHAAYAQDTRLGLLITVTSFGFKHGLPVDADLVFDVRFLANPHYVPALKALDGRDARVRDYIQQDPRTAIFQEKIYDLIQYSLPQYKQEGKAYLNIAIGCTGGQHRSVALAEEFVARLRQDGYHVTLRHRDIPAVVAADAPGPTPGVVVEDSQCTG